MAPRWACRYSGQHEGAGLVGRYYYSDVPFIALWATRYVSVSRPFAAFLTDCAAGTLPHVAYVDPRFLGEGRGTSGDDHPHADVRNGQAFLNQVHAAVTGGPAWPSTVLVMVYDEWGGFFEHVRPPTAPIPPADRAAGNGDGLRGFRVPCVVVAPWAQRGVVSHVVYDHTSVLRAIEWRWGLAPLTVRDATANNLFEVLDFGHPRRDAPVFAVPPGPFGAPCQVGGLAAEEWFALRAVAQNHAWPIAS